MTEFNFDTVFDETMQTRNLDTVVILGHLNPDGDAAGSVMSLAHYIHVNYPQYRVFPYLAKTLERGPKKMVVEDKIFVPFEMPDISGKQYCVIVCDNATLERMIGLEYYQNAVASIVIDHHASNEGYGDVNWTKVSEACAENVYHMLFMIMQQKIMQPKKKRTPMPQIIFTLASCMIPEDWQGQTRVFFRQ